MTLRRWARRCQHEVSKATGLHLARQVKQAEARVAAAEAQREAVQAYRHRQPRPRGRPSAFRQRIDTALSELAQAGIERDQARARQHEARDPIRELGQVYHLYELRSGQAQSRRP